MQIPPFLRFGRSFGSGRFRGFCGGFFYRLSRLNRVETLTGIDGLGRSRRFTAAAAAFAVATFTGFTVTVAARAAFAVTITTVAAVAAVAFGLVFRNGGLETFFKDLFDKLDTYSEDEIRQMIDFLNMWGEGCYQLLGKTVRKPEKIRLVKVE